MINSPVDEIKDRLDIIEVIGSYIKLQKAGVNYRAPCPFHSEKKPSFFVSPVRQIWHCFGGCGEGGDIFKFVMKIEGVEFGDALRILAQRAGVELKKQPPELKTERQRLYEICELSAKFFEKQFEASSSGKEAKKYLLSRGINEESLKKWRVGYAPDVWQGLADFLNSRGYKTEEFERAGLAIKSEKSSFYDRFRGRIIFPIFDLNSQIIAFGGRIFGEKREEKEIAKYVNSPQTLLYDKSWTLYGLDKAKMAIRKKDACILVEGYIDLIAVSQAGFENVVATSGTALTPYQLKILKRYSDNLLLAFDMDLAGASATKRGIELTQQQDFNVKIITLPEGLDPADMILKDPKEWEKQTEAAKSILDFYFENTFAKFDRDKPEEKKAISKTLLPVIKRVPSKIIQSHWVKELARKLRVKEESVEEELKQTKLEDRSEFSEKVEANVIPSKTRKELLEERLIILILKFPKNNIEFIKEEDVDSFSPSIKEFFKKLKENPKLDLKKIDPKLLNLCNYLVLKAEVEEVEEKDILPEIQLCFKEIQSLEIRNKLDEISKEIKQAEEEKDANKISELTKKFNSLISK